MRVAVTGTPGTGKTTATDLVDADLPVVHLNDAIEAERLFSEVDEARDSLVADLDAIREWLGDREDLLVESHLAHHLDANRVVVLRCRPDVLEGRLRDRGEPETKASENAESAEPSRALTRKARENAESEALDVILSEAVERHGRDAVYEIDTTDREPAAVAREIEAVIAGTREPSAGEVSFIDYL
jgi:adenylate kinase